MRGAWCLLLAVLLAAAVPAGGQGISVSSACNPAGGAGAYPAGDPITFRYHGPLPDLPKERPLVVPPCVSVELQAEVTGKPPLTLTWEGPYGFEATGNPVLFDSGRLPAGEHGIFLTATNAYGEATSSVFLAVTKLESIPWAPTADDNPSPDLEVTFSITHAGAHEWRWDFGDGTVTPWQVAACAFDTSNVTHTFPVPGTYQVTASARNCRDGVHTSQPLTVSVGDPDVIELLRFEAQGCEQGFCIFARGQEITFAVEASATPERYLWDWDGNGTVDEVTDQAASHAYEAYGIYTPRLTVTRGTGSDTLVHEQYILVN